METNQFENQRWDDVVFENRNKEYGAYWLRQSYPNHVVRATFGGISFIIFALSLPYLISMVTGKDLGTICNFPPPFIELKKAPEIIVEQRHVRPQQNIKKVSASLIPFVSKDPVIETPVTPDEPQPPSDGDVVGNVDVDAGPSTPGVSEGMPLPVVDNTPVIFAEHMPEYYGGMSEMMNYIRDHIRYPSSAVRMGVEGKVYVSFVVGTDGSVSEVQIVRGIQKDCDREAVKVISSFPKWKPGRQHESPVRVRMILPIVFALQQ